MIVDNLIKTKQKLYNCSKKIIGLTFYVLIENQRVEYIVGASKAMPTIASLHLNQSLSRVVCLCRFFARPTSLPATSQFVWVVCQGHGRNFIRLETILASTPHPSGQNYL